MTEPMLMIAPPIAKTRFSDWRTAVKSIVGFWFFFMVTVIARAFLGTDPWTAVENRLIIVGIGIVFTSLVYLAIAGISGRSPIRRRALTAAGASLVASVIMGGILIMIQDAFRESKEVMRYQAREGFTVVEQGQTLTIERQGEKPVVVTLPTVTHLDNMQRIRYSLDAAVFWLFFFLAWSAFFLASQAQSEALGAQRRLADAESAAQAAQVRALRYQVNPHFLFNTLNSLSSLVMTGRGDRAEGMLLALSTFFRTSLSLDPTADVTLAEEIDLQRLYLDIEKARFPDRLHVEIDVPAELEEVRLPALILQPIVENAIKYGVSKSRKTVLLRIEARPLDDNRMVVEISNRMKNRGKEELPAATYEGIGLGLSNVCQRLETRFGNRASCRFGAMTGGGFKVALTIPVETNV